MRQIESRDSGTKQNKRPVESRDIGTVPGLSGILVPKCRDLLSRGILVAGLSRRFLSRSRLSRGIESRSRSRSWGFAGRDRDPDIVPGQPPIPAYDCSAHPVFDFSKMPGEHRQFPGFETS